MNTIICQGITLSGTQCNRRVKNKRYCYHHKKNQTTRYRQEKPLECIICCESLAKQRRSLECGHWIHVKCIVESAKAECPICRSELKLGKRAMKRISKIAKKRHTEYIQEEEDDLRNDLQHQVARLIAPTLRSRIYEVVGNLFIETDDIDVGDVLLDIFDDDTIQNLLPNWMSYTESDLELDNYDAV